MPTDSFCMMGEHGEELWVVFGHWHWISFAQSYFWIHDLCPYSQCLEATFAAPGTLFSPLSELR